MARLLSGRRCGSPPAPHSLPAFWERAGVGLAGLLGAPRATGVGCLVPPAVHESLSGLLSRLGL